MRRQHHHGLEVERDRSAVGDSAWLGNHASRKTTARFPRRFSSYRVGHVISTPMNEWIDAAL